MKISSQSQLANEDTKIYSPVLNLKLFFLLMQSHFNSSIFRALIFFIISHSHYIIDSKNSLKKMLGTRMSQRQISQEKYQNTTKSNQNPTLAHINEKQEINDLYIHTKCIYYQLQYQMLSEYKESRIYIFFFFFFLSPCFISIIPTHIVKTTLK